MMLFLLEDTLREHPVGFETRRRNIFDPEEDEAPESIDSDEPTKDIPGFEPISAGSNHSADVDIDEEDGNKKKEAAVCARRGCAKKPRFDSLFCSDSSMSTSAE